MAMGQAALDLYGATGKREWLTLAADTGRVIDTRFKDATGGFTLSLIVSAVVAGAQALLILYVRARVASDRQARGRTAAQPVAVTY